MKPTREEISQRAYQLWEKDGRKIGLDSKYWTEAENELLARFAPSKATPTTIISAPPIPPPPAPSPKATTMDWARPAAKRTRAQAR